MLLVVELFLLLLKFLVLSRVPCVRGLGARVRWNVVGMDGRTWRVIFRTSVVFRTGWIVFWTRRVVSWARDIVFRPWDIVLTRVVVLWAGRVVFRARGIVFGTPHRRIGVRTTG